MQEAKITVISTVKSGIQADRMETVSVGSYAEKGGRFYVRYEETEASGMEGCTTTLKWSGDAVTLLRHGTYELCQEFKTGGICRGIYRTPYLTIPLETRTHKALARKTEFGWKLLLAYKMIVGEQDESFIHLEIRIDLRASEDCSVNF